MQSAKDLIKALREESVSPVFVITSKETLAEALLSTINKFGAQTRAVTLNYVTAQYNRKAMQFGTTVINELLKMHDAGQIFIYAPSKGRRILFSSELLSEIATSVSADAEHSIQEGQELLKERLDSFLLRAR